MFEVLCLLVSRLVSTGDLTFIAADGRERSFGDGAGRPVCVKFNSPGLYLKLLINPELYLGEAYMEEEL